MSGKISFRYKQQEIYNPAFVKNLFNSMSKSYNRMNYITSFGFSERWIGVCVKNAEIRKGDQVDESYDRNGRMLELNLANAQQCHAIFLRHGLISKYTKEFVGCASGLKGTKQPV